jgi:hypothetical protein
MRGGECNFQTSSTDIAAAFNAFYRAIYANIEADTVSVKTLATFIRAELTQDMDHIY